jgi:hypothetical protein
MLALFIEIRDFPKALDSVSYAELVHACVAGIQNCIALTTCTWTRDGSMTSDILEALATLPSLKNLTINGHNAGYYEPASLLLFKNVKKVSIIMPSPDVVRILRPWITGVGGRLTALTLVCKVKVLLLCHISCDLKET